jgi:hypothetical protein
MKKINIRLYSHFHKSFPFFKETEWIIPTVFEEKHLTISKNQVCLVDENRNIKELLGKFGIPASRMGYLAQTIATEYWVARSNVQVDYVGVTGYRRYPMFNFNKGSFPQPLLTCEATPYWLNVVMRNENQAVIVNLLETYDAIIPMRMWNGSNIKEQFLNNQSAEIWSVFIDAIEATAPGFARHLKWFELESYCSYFGPMGFVPRSMFQEYSEMYIKIVSYMLANLADPFRVMDETSVSRSDRWIGYLAERFFAFYLFVYKVRTYEVPTVLLERPGLSVASP